MKKTFEELTALVEQWAEQKQILQKATPLAQAEKTLEEALELSKAVRTENYPEVADALGDVLVTCIIQAKMQGLDIVECLDGAYNVIAKRTGKMIDGVFVKDK
jgi:NTP pyrophosphatase (non-canonical NTP hydrolase)